jgi:oxalate decarboxylase/phosphoglucose isomerase-like protein (cupin superfamily)
MKEVIVIKSSDIRPDPLARVAGKETGVVKRVVYPHNVGAKQLFFGIAEINPGYSPHHWHRHTYYKAEGFDAGYSKDFEGVYYIISGSGVAQWKMEDGEIKEIQVSAGDTIFFPPDVAEHQVVNKGTEKMIIAMCGSPPDHLKLKG